MFTNYIRDSSNGNNIKRAAFFRLASTLTHVDTQLRRADDYVSGFLVNDIFATITRLVESFIKELELKKNSCRAGSGQALYEVWFQCPG
jgi:hypothetical protein